MTNKHTLGIAIPLIALALLALACSLPSVDLIGTPKPTLTPSITPTFTPSPTLTPSPTPTSTPTPSPTPTPLPEVRLAQAGRAMHNGDYTTAARLYAELLDVLPGDPPPQDASGQADSSHEQRRTAAFSRGKALLKDGDPQAAIEAFTAFLQTYPKGRPAAEAHFWLAQSYWSLDKPDSLAAVEHYRRYLELRGDLIGAYVRERIGEALLDAGEYAAAEGEYRWALDYAPTIPFALNIREKLAQLFIRQGDYTAALAQYDEILLVATYPTYRARIETLAGQTLLISGQIEAGYRRFLNVVEAYPKTRLAYDDLVALVEAGVEVDEFQRGLVDYYAGVYDPALAAFTRAIQADHRVADSRYYAGLAFREQGDMSNALRQFNLIIENFPQSEYWEEAWLAKAEMLARFGDVSGAVEVYRQFATSYPRQAQAPEALRQAALLLERSQRYAEAASAFRAYQAAYPYGEYASESLHHAGLAAYRAGDNAGALEAWGVLNATYPLSEYYPAALLWRGKLLSSTYPLSATQLFSQAVTVAPDTFFGLRAADELGGSAPLQPAGFSLDFDPWGDGSREATERAIAEAWLADRLGLPDPAPLRTPRDDIAADMRWMRGHELWRLGLQAEAREEFESLRRAYTGDAVALYQLAVTFREIGLYRSSIIAADNVIRLARARPTETPLFLAWLDYPTHYADLVVPEAEGRGLDPLLIFSVIRQESLFEGLAVSTAYANGLMQIIPSTGQEIAGQLGWTGYTTAELFKPYISVKFGTYYLARQYNGLEGNLFAALAAYNAGPGRSLNWLRTAGDDPDLFYETVTLSEPRLYIRRITEHYAVYQALYGW